ncbi:AB-hydrolase YheT [Suillus bovinus]|uniref:AB-hydrolase YheT n=1 Tax=Suillus bovinus TaxID=48563 RepID=UPI001B886CA6|nr:AB-hydrolase YheT [Suillus bovinus]KAG2132494.1 AB-hydrolase YheT [Suillus bovinus]
MSSFFNWWSASYTTEVRYSKESPLVVTKEQHSNTTSVGLRDFVERRCPSLYSEFRPAWWLPNGHMQTLYCVLGKFSARDKVVYKRTLLRLLDGGTLGLDFTPVDDSHLPPDTPIIVVLHGTHRRAILSPACMPVHQGGLGYRAVVVNFRGCAGVPVTSPQLYSAGHTDDLRQALFYISHRYPEAPLLGLSFSLGANVMTRYVAEEGERSRLKSACILGCVHRLFATYIGRHVYSKGMGRNLVNLLKRHLGTFNPDHEVAKAAAVTIALTNPTIDLFDEHFTRIGGGSSPPWPFASANDYYEYSSSHNVLSTIKIPLLAINAADDPVVQDVPMDVEGDGWVIMALTPCGGHLGWFEPDEGWGQVRRWIKRPVVEWLRATGEDFVRSPPRWRPLHEEGGFLKEVGIDRLGCRELDGSNIIVGTEGEAGLLAGL